MSRGSRWLSEALQRIIVAKNGGTSAKFGSVVEIKGNGRIIINGDTTEYMLMSCCNPVYPGDAVMVFWAGGSPIAFSGTRVDQVRWFVDELVGDNLAILFDANYKEEGDAAAAEDQIWCKPYDDGAECDHQTDDVWVRYREINYDLGRTLGICVAGSDVFTETRLLKTVNADGNVEENWFRWFEWIPKLKIEHPNVCLNWRTQAGDMGIFAEDQEQYWAFDERPLSIASAGDDVYYVLSGLSAYYRGRYVDYLFWPGHAPAIGDNQLDIAVIWRIEGDTASIIKLWLCRDSLAPEIGFGFGFLTSNQYFLTAFRSPLEVAKRTRAVYPTLSFSDTIAGVSHGSISVSADGSIVVAVYFHTYSGSGYASNYTAAITTYEYLRTARLTVSDGALQSFLSYDTQVGSDIIWIDIDTPYFYWNIRDMPWWALPKETVPPLDSISQEAADFVGIAGTQWIYLGAQPEICTIASNATVDSRVPLYYYGDAQMHTIGIPTELLALSPDDMLLGAESEAPLLTGVNGKIIGVPDLKLLVPGYVFVGWDAVVSSPETYKAIISEELQYVSAVNVAAPNVFYATGLSPANADDADKISALPEVRSNSSGRTVANLDVIAAPTTIGKWTFNSGAWSYSEIGKFPPRLHCGCPPTRYWRRGCLYRRTESMPLGLSGLPDAVDGLYRPHDPAVWCVIRK